MIEDVPHKISRVDISGIKATDIDSIRTNDKTLISDLKTIFDNKKEGYTVKAYLSEQGLKEFVTSKGQTIHRVSVDKGAVSNFYKVEKGENNYSYLSMLKYYCVEVYRNKEGKTRTWGIRYVDLVNQKGKLFVKEEVIPKDYSEHKMYLFKNDYIVIYNKERKIKFKGFYLSVKAVNDNRFYFSENNSSETKAITISKDDRIEKYAVSILGNTGGKIKCSVPLLLIKENS